MKEKVIKITRQPKKPLVLDTPGGYIVELVTENLKLEVVIKTKLANQEKANYHLTIKHLAPKTRSQTSMKAVVADQAKLNFFGKIIVSHEASQVEAFLEQRVLVLSDQAQVETKPELEILNNDVVCSHAASIAPPDETQLFYLMSRGLSHSRAIELMTEGFLNL